MMLRGPLRRARERVKWPQLASAGCPECWSSPLQLARAASVCSTRAGEVFSWSPGISHSCSWRQECPESPGHPPFTLRQPDPTRTARPGRLRHKSRLDTSLAAKGSPPSRPSTGEYLESPELQRHAKRHSNGSASRGRPPHDFYDHLGWSAPGPPHVTKGAGRRGTLSRCRMQDV